MSLLDELPPIFQNTQWFILFIPNEIQTILLKKRMQILSFIYTQNEVQKGKFFQILESILIHRIFIHLSVLTKISVLLASLPIASSTVSGNFRPLVSGNKNPQAPPIKVATPKM